MTTTELNNETLDALGKMVSTEHPLGAPIQALTTLLLALATIEQGGSKKDKPKEQIDYSLIDYENIPEHLRSFIECGCADLNNRAATGKLLMDFCENYIKLKDGKAIWNDE